MNGLETFDLASLGRIFTSDINSWPGDCGRKEETIVLRQMLTKPQEGLFRPQLTLRTLRRVERHKRRRFTDTICGKGVASDKRAYNS